METTSILEVIRSYVLVIGIVATLIGAIWRGMRIIKEYMKQKIDLDKSYYDDLLKFKKEAEEISEQRIKILVETILEANLKLADRVSIKNQLYSKLQERSDTMENKLFSQDVLISSSKTEILNLQNLVSTLNYRLNQYEQSDRNNHV